MRVNRPRLVAAALAVLLVGSAGGALYLWLRSPLATVDQRIAAATASLTAGALVIAVVAGVVALQAYRDAIRKPRLQLSLVCTRPGQFSTVGVSLANDGSVSAQYAVVWLQFEGDVSVASANYWTQEPGGVRWEAPAGRVIHPWAPAYTLPSVTLQTPAEHFKLTHTVAADGFGPIKGTQSFPDEATATND